jgi:hypothetical protein
MRKYGDRGEWRAPACPAEKNAHLQLANVEFQIAGKPPVALFRGQGDAVQIDAFGLHSAVEQKTSPVVFVAR